MMTRLKKFNASCTTVAVVSTPCPFAVSVAIACCSVRSVASGSFVWLAIFAVVSRNVSTEMCPVGG
jgi:hypothetical protein